MKYSVSTGRFYDDGAADLPADAEVVSAAMLDLIVRMAQAPFGLVAGEAEPEPAPVEQPPDEEPVPPPPPPPELWFYSPGTGGFYSTYIHAEIPGDAFEITAEDHRALIEGQANGMRILVEASGKPYLAEPLPPTPEAIAAAYQREIEAHVEGVARAKGYTSAVSCASYVASTIPAWKVEAEAFIAWRDSVWAVALALLNEPRKPGDVPSLESVLGALPVIDWP